MRSPYTQAADFFGRAFQEQEGAADYQEATDGSYDSQGMGNIRTSNPTIGSLPPSLFGNEEAEQDADSYMEGVKDSLIEEAKARRRPTGNGIAHRASGGINTAV